MFGRIGLLIDVFRKGSEVSNVEKWKKGGITAAALAAALAAVLRLAQSFGYDVPITSDQLTDICIGIVAIVGVLFPAATSKKAGLLPAKGPNLDPVEDQTITEGLREVGRAAEQVDVHPDDKAYIGVVDNPIDGFDLKR